MPPLFKGDHAKTLQSLRERLAILQGSPFPAERTEEIDRVKSVIQTYNRLHHSEIIFGRMEKHGA